MQRPQTFCLLRGSGVQAGAERPQARARGRGPRPARSPGGCTARAPSRAWGPVPARAAWKTTGCSGPTGVSAEATGPPREGGSAPLRLASVPRVRSRRSAGTRSWQVAGHWGAAGPGRPGRGAVVGEGRTGASRGLPRSQGGEVGARVSSSPAEMRVLLGLALRGRLEYFPRAGLRTLVGFSTRAGLFRFPLASPSDLDL